MKTGLVLAQLLLFLFFVMLFVAASRRRKGPWPYFAKNVLSAPEQVLYWRLVEALPGEVVLAQVQLSRFLGIKKGAKRMEWLNRISQKSADFVVCGKDFAVLLVIELDDSTHSRPGRRKADADKDKAIADAGLRLVRWHVKKVPSVEEIRAAVHPAAGMASAHLGDAGGIPAALAAIQPSGSSAPAHREDL
jgi:very-short-patch-repair endonuclease